MKSSRDPAVFGADPAYANPGRLRDLLVLAGLRSLE